VQHRGVSTSRPVRALICKTLTELGGGDPHATLGRALDELVLLSARLNPGFGFRYVRLCGASCR
jgi:hypothetical protein